MVSKHRVPWRGICRSLGVVLATAIVAAACSSGSGSASSVSWFFWVGSPAEVEAAQHNAQLVTDKYPNIHVDFSSTSWTSYWQKLPAEASTHSMPCIAGLQFGYVGAVGDNFIPLNSFIKKNHFSLKPFEPAMIHELSHNGKLLALPYDFGPVVIAYNKDLFAKKHVPLPKSGWTWQQFLDTAKKLTGNGTYGWLPGLSNELAYDLTGVPNAYVNNGKFDATNPAWVQGIEKQAELSYKYHVTPTFSTSPNWATQEFDSGNVGMETQRSLGADLHQGAVEVQRRLGRIPAGTEGDAHLQRGIWIRHNEGLQDSQRGLQGDHRADGRRGSEVPRVKGPRLPGKACGR